MLSATSRMHFEKCTRFSLIGIISFFLAILSISGCSSGGGGSSQVTEGPPATPTGVSVAITAPNGLTVSWNSVANASSYNVYWTTAPGANKTSSKVSGITSPQYVHAGLATGVTYYYVVTAVNSFGESSESAEAFALLDIPRPTGAISAVAGDGQVALSWNTNGAVSYNIYMGSQPGVTKANNTPLASSTVGAFTATGLANGKTYYFAVTSVNSFGESGESSEVAATPAASSSLSVSGLVTYEDKEYGLFRSSTGVMVGGFTGNTFFKAVRFADVEAVDVLSGSPIASGSTDGSGVYSLAIPSAYASREIYIRVISSSLSPAVIAVKDLSDALHAVAGANFPVSGTAAANISVHATSPAAGAFNILDVYASGAEFVRSLSATYPPAIAVYWQTGNNIKGTYFCSGASIDYYCQYGEAIYILNESGDTGDTDGYDDDVLWHEYGHFVASKYSKDDSPGGYHQLSSNDLDLRLAWSEGWGGFFPSAVKTWLNANAPALLSTAPTIPGASVYVDTLGGDGWYYDFMSIGGYPYYYASSEVAVSKVLYVLSANTNYGTQPVWNTVSSMRTAATPVSLETFWDAWSALGNANIAAILSERAISYYADSYEALSDNAPNASRKLTIGMNEVHNLFGSGDIDVVAFDAIVGQTYTVKTSALRNGADTYVRIIATDGTTEVAVNDNRNGADYSSPPFVPNNCDMYGDGECHENGADILGSTATFTADLSGTYYAEISSSPKRPLSAGKYGDYLLTITTP